MTEVVSPSMKRGLDRIMSNDLGISVLGKKRHKTDRKSIIAVDGEGVSRGAQHFYTLLAASNGDYVERADELRTDECFDFLLRLKNLAIHGSYLIVGFSLNYDVNMWLVDLPRESIEHLLVKGHLYWRSYVIRYKPGKTFYVKDRRTNKSVTIYDVFGFFQCSFVKALKDWNVGESVTVAEIASMKDKRGTFDAEHAAQVRAYCFQECALLVQLVQRLIVAVNNADIPCAQWYGVGALASGMMKKYRVKTFMAPPPDELRVPILSAYFGGRFEIAGTGHFGKTYGYDIKSAYPSVARTLPCLAHTYFTHTNKYDAALVALWRVEWSVKDSHRWGPFPWRTDRKQIHYPLNGAGWYWSTEVAAAKSFYKEGITVVEGYVLNTTCDHAPFDFINDVYAARQQLEAAGDYAHKALKLALNALYGKTAQSIGGKRVPPYQSYIWSGMITAGCRAQILSAIAAHENAIISIATDGILSTAPLKLPIGKALDMWDAATYAESFLVQPGIYKLTTTEDQVVTHTRGFGSKETDFTKIESDFARNPLGKHHYSCVRFIGAAAALAHKDYLQHWRRWIPQKRMINFVPSSRFIIDMGTAQAGIEPIWSRPPRLAQTLMSTEYAPKQSWLESWLDDVDLLIDLDQP